MGLLFSVAILVFLLPRLLPGDPLDRLLQQDAMTVIDPADRDLLAAHYGLDASLPRQFVRFLGDIGSGDLGWSISKHQRVTSLIGGALPWTLLVAGSAVVLSAFVGFIAGTRAAWKTLGRADRVFSAIAAFARSTPDYAIATTLLIVFGVLLKWLPLTGSRTPFSQGDPLPAQALDIARHAAMPIVSLSIALVGSKFLLARSSMRTVLSEDYLQLARAKGLTERRVRLSHGSPNAMVPFMAQMGAQIGMAVGGSVFVERVFAYPGMGTLITEAVDSRDYPLLDGCFLTLALLVVTANAGLDVWMRRHDPRMAGR